MKTILLALLLTANCFADTGWLFQPYYTKGTNNPSQTATAGNQGQLYFNNSSTPNQVFIKTDDFVSTNWVPVTSPSTAFLATCTQTAATATTITHCLPSAQVPTGQHVVLTEFHADVNGATAWSSEPSCVIQDTTTLPFITITSLTANAYLTGSSTGTTRSAAYYLGSGAVAGAGLDVVCNANGAGSPLVFTLFGVIKNP